MSDPEEPAGVELYAVWLPWDNPANALGGAVDSAARALEAALFVDVTGLDPRVRRENIDHLTSVLRQATELIRKLNDDERT